MIMKKIIARKKYDTETATAVAQWCDGEEKEPNFIRETLYIKRTGEFFLHGKGGVNTRYSHFVPPRNWEPGEEIIPLLYHDAKRWAEKHLTAEDYEELFGEIPEDHSKGILCISMSKAGIERLKRNAAIERKSLGEYVEKCLNLS